MKLRLIALVLACPISSSPVSAVRVHKENKVEYIVFVIRPDGVNPEAFDYKILAEAVGSMEAAKKALIYHYVHPGFAAFLTPAQVEKLTKDPRVLTVFKSGSYSLFPPPTV